MVSNSIADLTDEYVEIKLTRVGQKLSASGTWLDQDNRYLI